MKALVLQGYNDFVYKDVDDPTIKAHEVLVGVEACGICGSDVHGMDGSTGRRKPPVIMGHEAAGIIVDVGNRVSEWKKGDRVTFDSTIYCGTCWYCKKGKINLCDNRQVLGVSCDDYKRDGAFAEFVAVPQHILYSIPESVSFVDASMIETISIALHSINRVAVSINDTAVVIGAGMIGLLIIQLLKINGCKSVIAVDINPLNTEKSLSLGADHAFISGKDNVLEEIKKISAGRGADVAFEAVGLTESVQLAINSVRKDGLVSVVGNISPSVEIPLQNLVTRELSFFGSCASQGEYETAIDLLASKRIDTNPLISATAPLSEGGSWFKRLYLKEDNLLKVVLVP